ncbi:hypothetical protein BDA99DRAFT_532392 [Phascolomyces articulosus]|uniref:Uncharacterized protein n=1 Tax=Phascolomyces articulosus TaxID=60185 RepID=A0AAD5K9B3_9FUNG|nr:hypothetical protein BDA99DRAFT_532392 [Phascolomyces articulosus]
MMLELLGRSLTNIFIFSVVILYVAYFLQRLHSAVRINVRIPDIVKSLIFEDFSKAASSTLLIVIFVVSKLIDSSLVHLSMKAVVCGSTLFVKRLMYLKWILRKIYANLLQTRVLFRVVVVHHFWFGDMVRNTAIKSKNLNIRTVGFKYFDASPKQYEMAKCSIWRHCDSIVLRK